MNERGPHIVAKRRPGKPIRWYVYAWRGGPCVHKKVGGVRPLVVGSVADAISEARAQNAPAKGSGTIDSIVQDYLNNHDWEVLSKSTKRSWQPWILRIREKFGSARTAVFDDRRIKADILRWRDQWYKSPRSADMAVQVISRVLSHGVQYGFLEKNHALGIKKMYKADRSDLIWEVSDILAFNRCASINLQEGLELAASTGLRRSDLVAVPWSAVKEHAIVWETSKSNGQTEVVVPLLPETRALLKKIEMRHASEMQRRPASKRTPLPETILSNSRWEPWTPQGFGGEVSHAKRKSGIKVTLHDVRGTFATRCITAGLSDQDIAGILGWDTADVARIRKKYVNQGRVNAALAERISRGTK